MLDTKKMTHIGSFSVDSGQAMVGDPCYLDNWKDWNSEEEHFDDHVNNVGEYGYLGACNATLTNGHGVLGLGNGVVFSTGYGDGVYPVYAEINEDGRIVRVVIEFLDEEIEE